MKVQLTALMIALLSVGIVACNDSDESVSTPVVEETTPESIELIQKSTVSVFKMGSWL